MWKDIAFLSESSFIINVSETFWTVQYYPEKRTAVVFSQIIAGFHPCEITLKIFKGQVGPWKWNAYNPYQVSV